MHKEIKLVKKIFGFLITITIMLSIVCSSLAIVDTFNMTSIEPYLGLWINNTGSTTTIINIGKDADSDVFLAVAMSYHSQDFTPSGVIDYQIFNMTIDTDCVYLTSSDKSVDAKMKAVDVRLLVYSIGSAEYQEYEKLIN